MTSYFVYILECSDGLLYTGITNNLEKRVAMHNSGKGAKFTKGRGPVTVKYFEEIGEKGMALKREIEIKKLTRAEKLNLLSSRA